MFDTHYATTIKKLKGSEQLDYLENVVLKELTFPHQLSEFINDVLRKSTKESNWQVALKTAELIDDKGVWGTLTNALKLLADKSNKPTWLLSYVEKYSENVDVLNYNLKSVLTIFVRVQWIAPYLKNIKPKFPLEDTYRAVRDILPQINPKLLRLFIDEFNDWNFIEILYNGKLDNITEQKMIAQALRKVHTTKLKNFSSFDLEWLMTNHPEPFTSVGVINSAIAAFKVKNSDNATTLLTNFIMEGPFEDDLKIAWLWEMYDVDKVDKNETINAALYKLTGKEMYLPETVKDIFIF